MKKVLSQNSTGQARILFSTYATPIDLKWNGGEMDPE